MPFSSPRSRSNAALLMGDLRVRVLMLTLIALLSFGMDAAWSAPTQREANCSWARPGHNPFMGDVVAAVDRYTDIPADARARLKVRMAKRDYDDIADIRRDSLQGRHSYDPAIRDMHFGTSQVCSTVSRSAWSPTQHERGLVYCEAGQCIIVPTVCRNVSRVTRHEPRAVAGAAAGAPEGELLFEPPGAGVPPATDGGGADAGAGPLGLGGGGAGPSFADAAGVPSIVAAAPPIVDGPGAPGGDASGPSAPPPFVAPPFVPTINPGIFVPSLPAVPEPSTWCLMLAGLLAVGARASIRRRRTAVDTIARTRR